MVMEHKGKAITVLTLNTIAFTVCFAAWMLNGVLVTFLVALLLYLHRFCISYTQRYLQEDLGINDTQLGEHQLLDRLAPIVNEI